MKQEDLFRAIGELESLRLAKTEEDLPMKTGMKLTRRLLIAAVVTALLAGSAYAVHYFLFDSPKEMVTGLYGSNASLAPSEASDEQKPWPNSYVLPGYDKRPVDETTAQAMEGWISPVGQTLKNGGYQLTVDAYVYDSAMKVGFVTLALEHDKPIDEADLMMQRNGEIIPGMVEFTQYGRCYIIPEKTTQTTLAMTYYFSSGVRDSHVFAITLLDHDEQKRILEESSREEQERSASIAQRREALMAELTPEEAQAKLMEQSGFSGGEAPYDAYYYLAANEYDWNYASSHPPAPGTDTGGSGGKAAENLGGRGGGCHLPGPAGGYCGACLYDSGGGGSGCHAPGKQIDFAHAGGQRPAQPLLWWRGCAGEQLVPPGE